MAQFYVSDHVRVLPPPPPPNPTLSDFFFKKISTVWDHSAPRSTERDGMAPFHPDDHAKSLLKFSNLGLF